MDKVFYTTYRGRDEYRILELSKLDEDGKDLVVIDRYVIEDEVVDFDEAVTEYLSLNYADADVQRLESQRNWLDSR